MRIYSTRGTGKMKAVRTLSSDVMFYSLVFIWSKLDKTVNKTGCEFMSF